jgi:hypothetical protein
MKKGRQGGGAAGKAVRFGLLPAIIYFAAFFLLTYPLITKFSTHFFTDDGDGLTNVWNVWWINQAVTVLHQNPWETGLLHYPGGTSLLGHTLNPFNGFLAIPLLKVFSLVQAFNICVVFSFVMGGLTAFGLAWRLSRSYRGSLFAGFIFSFCNYHFAHAQGHMQLVSLEWIPLFVLAWYILMSRPSLWSGIGSGLALFLVLLCDYYYFLYGVMIAAAIYGWKALRERNPLFIFRRGYPAPILGFLATAALTSGLLVRALILLNRRDPLFGAHPTSWFSLDLPSILIPGGHWRFASWTKFYWSRLPGNIHESSVYLGLALLIFLTWIWIRRKSVHLESIRLWYSLIGIFIVLAMGPNLQFWGRSFPGIKLPYALMEILFPPLKLGGVPVRMMIVPVLAAAVILAAGFEDLFAGSAVRKTAVVALAGLLVFEFIPSPMPATPARTAPYARALKALPGPGGVIDLAVSPSWAMYNQTIHGKPLALGYIARIPVSVERRNAQILTTLGAGDWTGLKKRFGFRYIAVSGPLPGPARGALDVVFSDGATRVYEIR